MSLKEKKLFFDVEHSIYTFFLLFPCRVVEPWAAPLLSRFRSPRAGGPGFSLAILARAIIIALSKVTEDDKAAMTRDGLIRAVPAGTVKRFGKFFTVYEAAKHRRRAILWPEEMNEFLDWEGDMSLK